MSLVQMTLSGGVLVLFIVVVRALALYRLPKGAFLALWEVAALRLLLPFTVPLPRILPGPAVRLPVVREYLAAGGGSALGPSGTGLSSGEPVGGGAASVPLLPVIWLTFAVLMAVYFAVLYLRARRRFCCSRPDDSPAVRRWLTGQRMRRPLEVRRSALVSSPLTYGILRPVILLPEELDRGDETALTCILTHELIHIRRFDAAAKLIFAAVLCVHWFNPLAWVLYVLANRDLELSCDEAVMNMLGGREKACYALTLISMEEARSRGFSLYNHFGKLVIEERIELIMKYKKASLLAMALAIALVFGTTAVFAASAPADSTPAPNRQDDMLQGYLESDFTVMSYVDRTDGKTYYSFDGGKTFEPLTDEEFARRFPGPKVEWWTYEEYAAWLEQEKLDLQGMLGEKGWTGGRGDFVWTQEMIDETIAMYEKILQEIREGALYSKSVDGDTEVMLASGGAGSLASFREERSAGDTAFNIQAATYAPPEDHYLFWFGEAGDLADKAEILTQCPPGSNIISFGTKAELEEHLRALDVNEEKGLDRYAGFETLYAGIDPSVPVIYIIQ